MEHAIHRSAGWGLARSVSAPGTARRVLTAQLVAWRVGEPERAAATMIASELVTNAVQHAATACDLSVRYDGVVVAIDVRDGCILVPRLQALTLQARTGRGLQIVDRLSARWGYVVHSDGKTIWADIHRREDPASSPGRRMGHSGHAY